jgi:mannose-6-phosphate isomerase
MNEIENRPWGTFEILHEDDICKIKKIEVFPYHRLSYQIHNHRDEHWFVISGEGVVVINGIGKRIVKGDSIDIPRNSAHRVINTTTDNINLTFIEVQTGDYFGEDDIIRLEDDYGRS